MEHRFFQEIETPEVLASGDASQPSASLQVTPSVLALGLVQDHIVEESTDDDSSVYENDDSSTYTSEQPLSPRPTADTERSAYTSPLNKYKEPEEQQNTLNFEAEVLSKKPTNQRPKYIRTNRFPFCSKYPKYKDMKSSVTKKPRPIGLQRSRSNSCVDGGATLCLTEISRLLSCDVCDAVPMTSLTVHCCASGHQACGECFSTGYRVCMECKKPLEGRNEVLEKVLQRLRQVCPGLFPHEPPVKLNSELQLKLDEAEKADKSKTMDGSKLVQHSTHRPLDCPHLCCRRVIAANGLLAHFQFEHPSVPVFETAADCAHQFGLSRRCFENRSPRAIAILEVYLAAPKCGAVRKYSPHSTDPEKRATFLPRRDAVVCVLLGASLQLEETPHSEFLLAWCACLHDDTPLNYSLRATSSAGSETCYNGPTSSLHNSQDLVSILREAQCLFLSSAVFGQDKDRSRRKESVTFDLQFNFKQ